MRTRLPPIAACIVCLTLLAGLAASSFSADQPSSLPAPEPKPAAKLPDPPGRIADAAVQARECIECHEEIEELLEGDKHIADDFHCVVCHGRSEGHLEMKIEGTLPDRAWRRWVEEKNTFEWRMKDAAMEIAKFCASCHDRKPAKGKNIKTINWKDYLDTGHGMAVSEGNRDAPTCTDCHYAHGAGCEPLTDQTVVRRCALCHADKKMMKRVGMDPNVIDDFKANAHGKMSQASPEKRSTCIKCHPPH